MNILKISIVSVFVADFIPGLSEAKPFEIRKTDKIDELFTNVFSSTLVLGILVY